MPKAGPPVFKEGDPFRTIIPLTGLGEESGDGSLRGSQKTREKTREKILEILGRKPDVTTQELSAQLRITPKGIEWQINKLKQENRIRRIGPDKGGHWDIVKSE